MFFYETLVKNSIGKKYFKVFDSWSLFDGQIESNSWSWNDLMFSQ